MAKQINNFQPGFLKIGPKFYENVKIDYMTEREKLGAGTFGNVTKYFFDNKMIAVKSNNDNNKKEKLFNDKEVMIRTNSPHIVSFYGYIDTFDRVYLCMETMAMCMETLCQNYIKPNEMNIPECILGKITVAIVEALRYLKNVHGLIHRDIKPSNILIDWDGLIKLADFGVSGSINNVSSPDIPIHGCIQYCPPGVLDHRKQDQSEFDERYDIWGLRISLYEMATLKPAYNFIDNILFELSIINDTVPPLPKNFSLNFQKFINSCLEKDVVHRSKYRILVNFPWYKIHKILDVDLAFWMNHVFEQHEHRQKQNAVKSKNSKL